MTPNKGTIPSPKHLASKFICLGDWLMSFAVVAVAILTASTATAQHSRNPARPRLAEPRFLPRTDLGRIGLGLLWNDRTHQIHCQATLVNNQSTILTAAHCLPNDTSTPIYFVLILPGTGGAALQPVVSALNLESVLYARSDQWSTETSDCRDRGRYGQSPWDHIECKATDLALVHITSSIPQSVTPARLSLLPDDLQEVNSLVVLTQRLGSDASGTRINNIFHEEYSILQLIRTPSETTPIADNIAIERMHDEFSRALTLRTRTDVLTNCDSGGAVFRSDSSLSILPLSIVGVVSSHGTRTSPNSRFALVSGELSWLNEFASPNQSPSSIAESRLHFRDQESLNEVRQQTTEIGTHMQSTQDRALIHQDYFRAMAIHRIAERLCRRDSVDGADREWCRLLDSLEALLFRLSQQITGMVPIVDQESLLADYERRTSTNLNSYNTARDVFMGAQAYIGVNGETVNDVFAQNCAARIACGLRFPPNSLRTTWCMPRTPISIGGFIEATRCAASLGQFLEGGSS